MKQLFQRLFGGKMTYRRAFVISILINALLFLSIGLSFKFFAEPILASEQLKVEFMTQQEADVVENEVNQELEQSPEPEGQEGGSAGTDLSAIKTPENTPDSGTQDPNAYSENGTEKADPRKSSNPGTSPNVGPNGKKNAQGSGSGGDVRGTKSGPTTSKPSGNVDISGYQSRINNLALDSYPPAAQDLGRQGTVVYSVTFDSNGKPVSASLVKSSGTAILDKHAYKMIFKAGSIVNTTGSSVTKDVRIKYVL